MKEDTFYEKELKTKTFEQVTELQKDDTLETFFDTTINLSKNILSFFKISFEKLNKAEVEILRKAFEKQFIFVNLEKEILLIFKKKANSKGNNSR